MILDRIQRIQTIFLQGKEWGKNSASNLEEQLSTIENPFLAVGFEGAAMGLALKDLEVGNDLHSWRQFFEKHKSAHFSQLCVGLGWAYAENGKDIIPFLSAAPPDIQLCVLDGYGYYKSIYSRRETLRNQEIPKRLNNDHIHGFDQGVGRSLWYFSQGDLFRLLRMIDLFPVHRRADLWRGIGIAVAYVGVLNKKEGGKLIAASDHFLTDLSLGVFMAVHGRKKSSSILNDTTLISHYFLGDRFDYSIVSFEKQLQEARSIAEHLKGLQMSVMTKQE